MPFLPRPQVKRRNEKKSRISSRTLYIGRSDLGCCKDFVRSSCWNDIANFYNLQDINVRRFFSNYNIGQLNHLVYYCRTRRNSIAALPMRPLDAMATHQHAMATWSVRPRFPQQLSESKFLCRITHCSAVGWPHILSSVLIRFSFYFLIEHKTLIVFCRLDFVKLSM